MPVADIFPEVLMDATTKIDGKRYGITEKFGYNSISYNNTKADAADMQTLASLLGDKYKGRIAIYDYYLPVIGMAAMAIGKKTAERLLLELKGKLGPDLSGVAPTAASESEAAIVQALVAVGYSEREASLALKALPAGCGVSEGIKLALKALAR